MHKMTENKLFFIALSVFMLAIEFGCVNAQTLLINISNIRTNKGKLCVAIFDCQKNFEQQKPLFAMCVEKRGITNGSLLLEIPFKTGNFGVSVLDDTNENGKMDYHFLGIPAEGFGFSDYVSKGIKVPKYGDFSFWLEKNERKNISVVLRYI